MPGQSLHILPRVTVQISRAELCEFWRMACLGTIGAMNTPPNAAHEVLLGPRLLLECKDLSAINEESCMVPAYLKYIK